MIRNFKINTEKLYTKKVSQTFLKCVLKFRLSPALSVNSEVSNNKTTSATLNHTANKQTAKDTTYELTGFTTKTEEAILIAHNEPHITHK